MSPPGTPDPSSLAARLAAVQARVDAAVERRGPGPEVTLIGVGKRHPVGLLEEAHAAGLMDLGENYAQELRDKLRDFRPAEGRPEPHWHFIGALQSNKVKYVVGHCALIHTVDRPSLIDALERRGASQDVVSDVLIEVNLGESQKAGLTPEGVPALLDRFATTPHVRCVGLMIIPPPSAAHEDARPHFRRLRSLRNELAATPREGVDLRHLSMGMSSDFEIAIEEGATLVRVGTAIFGARPTRS